MRKKVIYQSEALFVGPTSPSGLGACTEHYSDGGGVGINEITGHNLLQQLHRIQSANYSFSIERGSLEQFGELAAIDYPEVVVPVANLEFTYLMANFNNERNLGFDVNTDRSALSGVMSAFNDEKNYFIKTVGQGIDAIGGGQTPDETSTIGLGNCVIGSYQTSAAVGALPITTVGVQGINMVFDTGVEARPIPAINRSTADREQPFLFTLPEASGNAGTGDLAVSVITPGDILTTVRQRLSANGYEENTTINEDDYNLPGPLISGCVQGYNLNIDLPRNPLDCLGKKFGEANKIRFPATISLGMDVIVNEVTTGSLHHLFHCNEKYDIDIKLLKPQCSLGRGLQREISGRETLAKYNLRNMIVSDIGITSNIGGNKTASISFVGQIGGPNQLDKGLFLYDCVGRAQAEVIIPDPPHTPEEIACATGFSALFLTSGVTGMDSFDCYNDASGAAATGDGFDLMSGWSSGWQFNVFFLGLATVDDFETYNSGDQQADFVGVGDFGGVWNTGYTMDGVHSSLDVINDNYPSGSGLGIPIDKGSGWSGDMIFI